MRNVRGQIALQFFKGVLIFVSTKIFPKLNEIASIFVMEIFKIIGSLKTSHGKYC